MKTNNPYGEPISNEDLAALKFAARGLSHHSNEAYAVERAVAARRWAQDTALLEARERRVLARRGGVL